MKLPAADSHLLKHRGFSYNLNSSNFSYQTPSKLSDCPNTAWCRVSSVNKEDSVCVSGFRHHSASNFLLLWLHPHQSSRGRGVSRSVGGGINSIFVSPNCCLYQVPSMPLTSQPRSGDGCFLSKTTAVRLWRNVSPRWHILWLSKHKGGKFILVVDSVVKWLSGRFVIHGYIKPFNIKQLMLFIVRWLVDGGCDVSEPRGVSRS